MALYCPVSFFVAVENTLDQHVAEKQDYGLPLFNLLSVMLFLDRAEAA